MGSGDIAPTFLTVALDVGEMSVALSGCFTPGEIAPDTHCIGGWVGPDPVLIVWSRENYCFCQELNPGNPDCSLLL
jgi:hypothetical protein